MALFLRSIKTDFPSLRLSDFIDHNETFSRFGRKLRTGFSDEVYGRESGGDLPLQVQVPGFPS